MFITAYYGDQFDLHIQTYAHRTLTPVIVTELTLTNAYEDPIQVHLTANKGSPSPDIDFTPGSSSISGTRYTCLTACFLHYRC